MDKYIRKILEMIAKGKISSDDGEKLINEILRQEKRDNNGNEPVSMKLKDTKIPLSNVTLNVLNGNVQLYGRDEKGIDLKGDGLLYSIQEGDTFFVKSHSADNITINMEKQLNLNARVISGDIECNDIIGNSNIVTVSGDIKMSNVGNGNIRTVSGDIYIDGLNGNNSIKSVSGDIWLKIIEGNNIEIDSVSSDITIELPKDKGVKFNIHSKNGDIDSNINFDNIEEENKRTLIAQKGDGKIKLNINCREGNIKIEEY